MYVMFALWFGWTPEQIDKIRLDILMELMKVKLNELPSVKG